MPPYNFIFSDRMSSLGSPVENLAVCSSASSELSNLRAEVIRLRSANDSLKVRLDRAKKIIFDKDQEIMMHNEKVNIMGNKIREAGIRETKARVSRELISTELSRKNVNNAAQIEKITNLEKEIEKKDASEDEKLTLLIRQKEALYALWKKDKDSKIPSRTSGRIVELTIDDLIKQQEGHLDFDGLDEEESLLNSTQEQVVGLVDRAKRVCEALNLDSQNRQEIEDEEYTFTTHHTVSRRHRNGAATWEVMDLSSNQTTTRSFNPSRLFPKEELVPEQGGEISKLSHLPNLDELLEEIRKENGRKESSFSD